VLLQAMHDIIGNSVALLAGPSIEADLRGLHRTPDLLLLLWPNGNVCG
jgi:hypothetical protein